MLLGNGNGSDYYTLLVLPVPSGGGEGSISKIIKNLIYLYLYNKDLPPTTTSTTLKHTVLVPAPHSTHLALGVVPHITRLGLLALNSDKNTLEVGEYRDSVFWFL